MCAVRLREGMAIRAQPSRSRAIVYYEILTERFYYVFLSVDEKNTRETRKNGNGNTNFVSNYDINAKHFFKQTDERSIKFRNFHYPFT